MNSDVTIQFSDAMRLVYAGWFIGIGVMLVLAGAAAYALDWWESKLAEDE